MIFRKTFTTLASKLDHSDMHQLVERVLKPYVTKEQLRQTILSNTLQNTKRMAANERHLMSTITSRNNTEFWKFVGLLGAGCLTLLGLGQKLDEKIDKLEHKLDEKIDKLEQKLDEKIDKLEQKIDQKFDKLEQKLDKLLEARQK